MANEFLWHASSFGYSPLSVLQQNHPNLEKHCVWNREIISCSSGKFVRYGLIWSLTSDCRNCVMAASQSNYLGFKLKILLLPYPFSFQGHVGIKRPVRWSFLSRNWGSGSHPCSTMSLRRKGPKGKVSWKKKSLCKSSFLRSPPPPLPLNPLPWHLIYRILHLFAKVYKLISLKRFENGIV